MLRLYLVAHAPTAAQRLARFPADEGIEPVDQLVAGRVRSAIGAFDASWRGPELRCAETATALGLAAESSEALRAWSVGTWAGRDVRWVAEHDPGGLGAWRTDPDAAPGGGESLTALTEREAGWLKAQERPNGRILVIADPSVIRAALLYVLDAGPSSFWRLDVAPWTLAVVQYANGAWRLRSLGSAGEG
jgi:broad specificity phosphatase PhoE